MTFSKAQNWQIHNSAEYFGYRHTDVNDKVMIYAAPTPAKAFIMTFSKDEDGSLRATLTEETCNAFEDIAVLMSMPTFSGIMEVMREFRDWVEAEEGE